MFRRKARGCRLLVLAHQSWRSGMGNPSSRSKVIAWEKAGGVSEARASCCSLRILFCNQQRHSTGQEILFAGLQRRATVCKGVLT